MDSVSDSRAPCTSWPPAFSDPKPIVVFRLIIVGADVFFFASVIAFSIESKSLGRFSA